jgi:hypothetical protein
MTGGVHGVSPTLKTQGTAEAVRRVLPSDVGARSTLHRTAMLKRRRITKQLCHSTYARSMPIGPTVYELGDDVPNRNLRLWSITNPL